MVCQATFMPFFGITSFQSCVAEALATSPGRAEEDTGFMFTWVCAWLLGPVMNCCTVWCRVLVDRKPLGRAFLSCYLMSVLNCLVKNNNFSRLWKPQRGVASCLWAFSHRRPLGLSFLRSSGYLDVVWTTVSQESIGGCKLFSTVLKISDECLVISSKAERRPHAAFRVLHEVQSREIFPFTLWDS